MLVNEKLIREFVEMVDNHRWSLDDMPLEAVQSLPIPVPDLQHMMFLFFPIIGNIDLRMVYSPIWCVKFDIATGCIVESRRPERRDFSPLVSLDPIGTQLAEFASEPALRVAGESDQPSIINAGIARYLSSGLLSNTPALEDVAFARSYRAGILPGSELMYYGVSPDFIDWVERHGR
ncbi:hypothetical protein GE253_00920 [Niveispirillum sp. SYP-B3756]|uniref:hypothetical protein n=1 Tax=Niveispirillum sp. SYP-B3756 TaxID=2662178 RepID=UPI0012921B00|nr:hypothetical protein [Niveispirillum sp. SYP-B3756]MQP63897.1 hypothetical protein [Niveispirillum sp. SYP-B3756]